MDTERLRLDPSNDTPIRFALTVAERVAQYGREYPVPPHVGDLIGLNHFERNVIVTAVYDDGTVEVRPYPNNDASR